MEKIGLPLSFVFMSISIQINAKSAFFPFRKPTFVARYIRFYQYTLTFHL